jgi:uncharacterized membrane protein YdjX (TVP38/TMEM64 family)
MTQNKWSRSWILLPFVVGIAAFIYFDGASYLQLETIKQQREWLQPQTQANFWWVYLGVGILYVSVTALSIPGATALSLLTGFLFGRWLGTGLIIIAATLGALLVFLAARHLFARQIGQRLATNKAAERMLKGFDQNAFNYLLFLRLVPAFPFWLVNLAPSLTSIPTRTYVIATAIGITPGAFVIANLGGSLGEIDSLGGLLSPTTLVALALLGAMALLPIFLKPWLDRLNPPDRTL